MQIQEQHHDTYVSLAPKGDLDANSSLFMDEAIGKLVERGQYHIHVDFTEVTYISSAGLGVFISYLDEITSNKGLLVFTGVTDPVLDVMELLGLHQLVTILPDTSTLPDLFSSLS